jgi:hypothetical protein
MRHTQERVHAGAAPGHEPRQTWGVHPPPPFVKRLQSVGHLGPLHRSLAPRRRAYPVCGCCKKALILPRPPSELSTLKEEEPSVVVGGGLQQGEGAPEEEEIFAATMCCEGL